MATDIGGVWRTIGGRRIFIKDGEDLATAMKKSGKFKNTKKKKEEKSDIEAIPFNDKIGENQKYFDSDEATNYFFPNNKFDETKNDEWNELKHKANAERQELSKKIDENVQANLNRTPVFKSKEEIKQWGKNLGIEVSNDFTENIDIRAMNDIKPVVEKMLNKYPELKNEFSLSMTLGDDLLNDGFAETTPKGINFNKKDFSDYSKALKFANEKRSNEFLVEGNGTIETIYAHEFGHLYETSMNKKLWDYEKENFGDRRWSTKEYDDVKHAFWQKKREDIQELKKLKGVSQYADKNDSEFFAEGFAEYNLGKSEFGKAFGQKMNEWNKEIENITSKQWGEMTPSQLMNKYMVQGYSKETAMEMALETIKKRNK